MMKLGAFIITYNRPEILVDTISSVFAQTYPPDFLWVIDNSSNETTQEALLKLANPKVFYFKMGYNAGPAGAVAKGLELCYKDGADWIYWGDDNDPPFREDCFERLLAMSKKNPFCGVMGTVGQFFDRKKGKILRIQTRLLEKKEFLEVDYIAGGMCMLVSKEVVKQEIFPNPDLFFGFEELDFCLKVKRKGFSILVDCELFLFARKKHGRLGFERPFYKKKSNLSREYYSLRNLLVISNTVGHRAMKRNLILKWAAKSVFGFRYGLVYGMKNAKMIFLAFYHYYRGILGKTIDVNA
jgi:GT2 family glycosyltransferase